LELLSTLVACDRAIEIDPRYAPAHHNRANALYMLRRFEEALAAFDRTIEIDPRNAAAHNGRGVSLGAQGKAEAAIEACTEVIRLRPDDADALCNLGHTLMRCGRFREAVSCFRGGHELGSRRAGWAHPSREWIESAERMAEMEGRLDRVLSGGQRPRDAHERVAFAELLYAKSRHAESARMYAEAFAEDAALAEDLAQGHRYNAACSAALEAARGGADAAEWRGRALDWLRVDLAPREKAPSELGATLEHWKRDRDLAAVRDSLDELPAPEREAWRSLWAAVDRALAAARPSAE
jgi:tetratricopeptide (TPR) repeat protein